MLVRVDSIARVRYVMYRFGLHRAGIDPVHQMSRFK